MINLNPILIAVRQAADLTRRVQQRHLVHSQKEGREPVTIADYGSQAILCRAISRVFPGDGVLAEEHAEQFSTLVSADQRAEIVRLVGDVIGEAVSESDVIDWLDHGRGVEAERTWVIDPIDGTKGFIALRRYSIAVGLLDGDLPIAGVLGSPGYPTPDNLGLLFHAQGSAAYVERMASVGKANRIAVSTRARPRDLKVVESVERDHAALELMGRIYTDLGIARKQVEGIDSQDKYAMLACGDADLYLRLPREAVPKHRAWDHAAGVVLVQAAGGVVTDLDGSLLDFSTGAILSNNKGMVVTNGAIHERVLEVVQAAIKSQA